MSSRSLCAVGVLALGLATACSSRDRNAGPAEEAGDVISTGSLQLPLTARGESGALYRLRDAQFQVRNDDFSVFQSFSTENDPLATTIETSLPAGNFFIDIFTFSTFTLEKVAADGEVTRVNATLLSPSSQTFGISPNQETVVTYSFETNGEVVNFGQGRLVITLDVAERAGVSTRSVIETSVDAVAGVSLRGTIDRALANAGSSAVSTEDVYHAIIDSFNEGPGRDPSLRHCDDELTDGQPSLNGFPLACPRLEGQQFDNLDSWFPLGFVNRMDLAPVDGANCGQQRMIFANNSSIGNSRMFIIMEAEIPNPSPECGLDACRPIAELWSSLATVTDAAERGRILTDAFLVSGTGPFAPFMNASNLGPNGGQIRTNNFNDFQWTLREFHMQPAPVVLPLPVSVAEAPNGELWNDLSTLPQAAACRESFLASIPGLTSDNVNVLGFPVLDVCEDAESPNDFFRQDYASHLSRGSGDFQNDIDNLLVGTGLSATDIANRARFAGSCMGCHIETGGLSLGNGVTAPSREDFVQISEFSTRCADGTTCFPPSQAMQTVFLPHRVDVLRNFVESPSSCGGPLPAGDAGVPVSGPFRPQPLPDLGVASAPVDNRGLRRTLGGQPFVDHAH